jgi:hypothetical protein
MYALLMDRQESAEDAEALAKKLAMPQDEYEELVLLEREEEKERRRQLAESGEVN